MAPSSRTPADQGAVVDRADQFQVDGSRDGRPSFTLKAKNVTGFAGDRKLLEGVELRIHDGRGGSVKVSGIEGQFDVSDHRARLSGNVTVESESEGLSLRTGTLFYDNERDMIFTADDITFSVGGLSGEGRGMNYLVADRQIKIPDRVVLHIAAGQTRGLPATLSSGDLVAALESNTAVLTENVRMERGTDVLYANYLKIQFDEPRKAVLQLHAYGDVIVTRPAVGETGPQEMRTDGLVAEFAGAKGELRQADLSGSCRLTSGPFTSISRSARYRKDDDLIELRGDPLVKNATDRIAAQEIDVRATAHTLEARGDVRTVSLPSAKGSAAALPGFGARSAVSFQARTLFFDQPAGKADYRGSARAWQEGNSIQGEEIVLDQTSRQLVATGNVMARFTQRRVTPQ